MHIRDFIRFDRDVTSFYIIAYTSLIMKSNLSKTYVFSIENIIAKCRIIFLQSPSLLSLNGNIKKQPCLETHMQCI